MSSRLLDEGQFNATCKFALLLALEDLALERGDDTGDALPLPLALIAQAARIIQEMPL